MSPSSLRNRRDRSSSTARSGIGQTDAMELRRARPDDLSALSIFAEPCQRRDDRHVVYLGTDAISIAAELPAEDEDWTAVTAVAEQDGALVGWLMGSVDAELGRVWWYGPFIDPEVEDGGWAAVADRLHDHARGLLPASVNEEELALDPAFVLAERWARGRGFVVDPGSVALGRPLEGSLDAPDPAIRPARPSDADVLGPLHDVLFPNTHTPGKRLFEATDEDHVRLVADGDGGPVGYVAVERQPTEAYIDFLGVAPEHRRRGIGRQLIEAALVAGQELGCDRAGLTVREANDGARALYRSLGFSEERILRPLRKGFRLP